MYRLIHQIDFVRACITYNNTVPHYIFSTEDGEVGKQKYGASLSKIDYKASVDISED